MNHSKIILITGATTGIGRHASLHLAKLGHRVFATGRRQSALDALALEAGDLPIETLLLDVTDAESIARAQAEVEARTAGEGVEALVNNAGYGEMGPLLLSAASSSV